MNIGFWTLSLSNSVEAIADLACQWGFSGVNLRCTRSVDGLPSRDGQLCLETKSSEIDEMRALFSRLNVTIPTMLYYHPDGHDAVYDWGWYAADITAHAKVAQRVGASRIRLMVGSPAPNSDWDTHFHRLFDCVEAGLDSTPDVDAVFENHPGSGTAIQIVQALEQRGNPRLGLIMSPDHMLTMQENIVALVERYPAQVKEVAYADRRLVPETLGRFDGRYYTAHYENCMPGAGDVPSSKLLTVLVANGFEGFVALKWEKSAQIGLHLPEIDEALPVFRDLVGEVAGVS